MAPLINTQALTKTFGARPLFENIQFIVCEGACIGLIGPNGSGKSTLLGILAGQIEPDSGEISVRKLIRLSYVMQDSRFPAGSTVRSVIEAALERAAVPAMEKEARLASTLGRSGFDNFEVEASTLSGGWKKRLAIAEALVQSPDVLLLDEPTNHLDLAGIEWLEALVEGASFACVVVSHDRYFLENISTETVELNRSYPDGLLRVAGNYSAFLEKKEEFLEAQAKRQEALANRVRSEIAWLRRGAKARTRKAKARIDKANEMIGELADLNSRTRSETARIDFSSTDRRTKRLIELEDVAYEFAERRLFSNLNFVITAGARLGLLGPNGSGKTTLLRLISGELSPANGTIRKADRLRVVYFDQNRELNLDLTLRKALAPEGDSVIYQDRSIHVASWATRFLFTSEQLNQPLSKLSGGEKARVLIAQLMLQPADVLLLDEPTNDLDIPTLEILEESLLEFQGALVLVTHDRYMLDRISKVIIGLDGLGSAATFADYSQWEVWMEERATVLEQERAVKKNVAPPEAATLIRKKKLSYLEAREFSTIEERITEAEQKLREKQRTLEDPSIASDASGLLKAQAEFEEAQKLVDELYQRWAQLQEQLD
ncbi:MAG TPA: ABC-F family ATP-binding cassette domain-containing protein [Candidatus Sulfotelmatobacter sp.]|nr:ABC-F family ATP-binding cassette domain-containing protein [Candidatus Sulfotelmatobacter sp.]